MDVCVTYRKKAYSLKAQVLDHEPIQAMPKPLVFLSDVDFKKRRESVIYPNLSDIPALSRGRYNEDSNDESLGGNSEDSNQVAVSKSVTKQLTSNFSNVSLRQNKSIDLEEYDLEEIFGMAKTLRAKHHFIVENTYVKNLT